MLARCAVLAILCVSSRTVDAVGNACSSGTCPSSFIQSKKKEEKNKDVLLHAEKLDENRKRKEEQAGQDGEMGMMNTGSVNQVKEDQKGHDSEMGEMGMFQEQAGQDGEKNPKPQEAKAAAQDVIKAAAQDVIAKFDKDGDAKINKSEAEPTMLREAFEFMKFEGIVPAGIEWNATTFDQGFKHIDKDGSGYLESKEIEAFVKEQASRDGNTGTMDTKNMNQVPEDQTGHDSEMVMLQDPIAHDGDMSTLETENTNQLSGDKEGHDGEMGLIQGKFWWERRRRRTLCHPESPCQDIDSGGTGHCDFCSGIQCITCDCHHYEGADRILPGRCHR